MACARRRPLILRAWGSQLLQRWPGIQALWRITGDIHPVSHFRGQWNAQRRTVGADCPGRQEEKKGGGEPVHGEEVLAGRNQARLRVVQLHLRCSAHACGASFFNTTFLAHV